MPGPGLDHSDIQGRFTLLLGNFLLAHQLGLLSGTGCYNLPLPNNTEDLLCPDLAYIEPARRVGIQMRGSYPVIAPDLVIEISSPNDFRPQMQKKAQVYLAAGVRLIWIVWPHSQTVDVWRPSSPAAPIAILTTGDRLDGYDVVPGFGAPVKDILGL
jgi:Uma2 family endonuclease